MLYRSAPAAYASPAPFSRLRFFAAPADEGAGGNEDTGDKGGGQENEPKFPANTPVKDMTPEQQIAFHENKARKLEDKLKGFNGLTPDQVTALQTELAEAKTKGLSAEDRAIEEAKEAGRTEVRTTAASLLVDTALSIALRGRVADASALLSLDKATFVKDGKADVDAIVSWVDENSEIKGGQKKGGPDLGQGRRGSTDAQKGVGAGVDLFAGTRKSKKTES